MMFKPRTGGSTLKELESTLCHFFPKEISENICDEVYRCKFNEALKEISEINWELDPYNGSCIQIPGKRMVQYFLYTTKDAIRGELFDILRVYSNKNDLRIQRNKHGMVVVTEW